MIGHGAPYVHQPRGSHSHLLSVPFPVPLLMPNHFLQFGGPHVRVAVPVNRKQHGTKVAGSPAVCMCVYGGLFHVKSFPTSAQPLLLMSVLLSRPIIGDAFHHQYASIIPANTDRATLAAAYHNTRDTQQQLRREMLNSYLSGPVASSHSTSIFRVGAPWTAFSEQ